MGTVGLCLLSIELFATASPQGSTIETAGLQWKLSGQGAIAQMQLGETTTGGQSRDGGLWIRPAPDAEPRLVPLATAGQMRTIELRDEGLRVAVRIEAQPSHLRVTGSVEDLRGQDRGVDVIFRVPMRDAAWWPRISEVLHPGDPSPAIRRRREKLPPGAAVLEQIERDGLAQNMLPVACVTDGEGRAGVGMAIPPDFPCTFRFACLREPGCLELSLPLGLSGAAEGRWKSRSEFRFLVYPIDGRWGLRDALRQYYALFPKTFARRTQSSGLWLFAVPSFRQVPDPQSYAFWEGPNLRELSLAESHRIETYPYIIVGQREIKHLAKKPAGYEDVAAALRQEPARIGKDKGDWKSVQSQVETCGLHDPGGRWVHQIRNTEWGGDSITFPVNPSPRLPAIAERPTVASLTLAEVEGWIKEHPAYSGIYVDSLASWGSYSNYRPAHFAAATAPLAHDPAGRVYQPNWMPHVDFLHALRSRIGSRLVFGNGIRPGRAFPAFACDILGVESSTGDLAHRMNLDFYRCVAAGKPFLSLFYYPGEEMPRAVVERYVQRFVALGLSPEVKNTPWGRNKQRDADLYARFLPIYRRLDRAGWQPVTLARVSDKQIWIERFGTTPPELYLTLYNPGQTTAEVMLDLQSGANGRTSLPKDCRLRELVEGKVLKSGMPLSIPPESLRVVQFEPLAKH